MNPLNIQLIVSLFKFLKELFFDRKEEADFRSEYFKPKRWLAFFSTIIAFSMAIFFGMRVVTLAQDYQEIKRKLSNCSPPATASITTTNKAIK